MRELSLFSGAGGGLLGTKLLGFRAVGYVERDLYAKAVLEARIRDGLLDPAPIFGDVRAFIATRAAQQYRGVADVVTAGFPCQPFSVAGKQLAANDPRNLWPETAAVLRAVRPRFALLENVPGLLSSGYFGTVLGDLAALGFDAEWTVLGADDVGAPHRRKRLWILAYADRPGRREHGRPEPVRAELGAAECGGAVPYSERDQLREQPGRICWPSRSGARELGDDGAEGLMADPSLDGRQPRRPSDAEEGSRGRDHHRGGERADLADADSRRREGERGGRLLDGERAALGDDVDGCDGARLGDTDESREVALSEEGPSWGAACESGGGWWSRDPADEGDESQPGLGLLADGMAGRVGELGTTGAGSVPRVAVGVPNRVDQLRALGNGQVPATVARAWRELMARVSAA